MDTGRICVLIILENVVLDVPELKKLLAALVAIGAGIATYRRVRKRSAETDEQASPQDEHEHAETAAEHAKAAAEHGRLAAEKTAPVGETQ